MSASTITPAAGFNLGASSSTNAGFGGFLTSMQSTPASASSAEDFDPGGLSAQQLAAAINNGSFESLSGAMSPAQLSADPNYVGTTSADYQGAINPDDIEFDGTPLSQLGIGQGKNDYGQTLLGSGYANPGLTYDGQPISNAQQNAAYNQLAVSQEHGDGQVLGFAAALVASAFLGPEIAAGYSSLMGAGTAATIAAGATTGAFAGGLDAGISGGNVGKGMLDGAITGGVGSGVSSALSGSVADGTLSSTTANAIKGAASGVTGSLINGGGFANVLTGAAIGGAGSEVAGLTTNALGGSDPSTIDKFIGGAAGGVTSAGLSYLNQSSQLPSQNSTATGATSVTAGTGAAPTSAAGFNIANPQSVGASQIGMAGSMPTANAPTDGAFNLGVNAKQS
jgi:hypothetical protein